MPGGAGSGAVREVAEPTPADGEILVDVVRVGLCGTDATQIKTVVEVGS